MKRAKYWQNLSLVERATRSLRFIIERPSFLDERAEEALRAFAARDGRFPACPVCARRPHETRGGCALCGWPKLRGLAFQERLSNFFRSALRRDPQLVARVKAECPTLPDDVACKSFTGPLAWLGELWRSAGKPPGRPFDPKRHFGIAWAIASLMRTHTLIAATGGERAFDTQIRGKRSARPGELMWMQRGDEPGLTYTEAVKVLTGEGPPSGLLPARRDKVPRPEHRWETLNVIGEDLRKPECLGYQDGSPPAPNEIRRSLRWANQQRGRRWDEAQTPLTSSIPEARWSGARPRTRRSS